MKNYKYVTEYYCESDTNTNNIIEKALHNAWRTTPSKNNFMNYKVHVLDADKKKHKEMLYWKCLQNETKANGNPLTTTEQIKKYEREKYCDFKPQFYNLLSAPFIFIFTSRICKVVNQFQRNLINNGYVYEQMFTSGPKKDNAQKNARIEIGMFAANFSSEVLKQGIDVSFTLCLPSNKESYCEPEFSFLDEHPIMVMTAGKGKSYRREGMQSNEDLKPDFDEIVNFIGKK